MLYPGVSDDYKSSGSRYLQRNGTHWSSRHTVRGTGQFGIVAVRSFAHDNVSLSWQTDQLVISSRVLQRKIFMSS